MQEVVFGTALGKLPLWPVGCHKLGLRRCQPSLCVWVFSARVRAAVCSPYHGSNCAADVNRVLALGVILASLIAFTFIQQREADVNNILLELKQEHIISGNLA